MDDVCKLISELFDKNSGVAYKAQLSLQEYSSCSRQMYPFMNTFIDMIDNKSSYVRTRGLLLIAYNSKWDIENKIDAVIDRLLEHITDKKPITSRQFIKTLPMVATNKPELKDKIVAALKNADVSQYADSMAPLVCKDIAKALLDIENI